MSNPDTICQFLYREAELCDAQDWDAYLALYDENCELHVPQWDSEHIYTKDPETEMSLMYYDSRAGLEDRVFRLRTGLSAASEPLPRTVHMLSNIRCEAVSSHLWQAKCNWMTNFFQFGESGSFFGWSHYKVSCETENLKIVSKQVVILNDTIKHVLDFYHI